MPSLDDVALLRHVPALRAGLPWVRIGHWPTPVEPLHGLPGARVAVFVKREDRSNPDYGGNKIRTLEPVLGLARSRGARRVWATGAYGSNHATATALHAGLAGLHPGIALFPQPATVPARANLLAMLASGADVELMGTIAELPFAMARLRRRSDAFVMAPGAASPLGALGALSAALELAEQIDRGECPLPARLVVAVGSTCTTAGILAGLHLASRLGAGFHHAPPAVTAVRVTPWPVTSRLRIARLAHRAALRVARRARVTPPSLARLYAGLTVEPGFLGAGYGRATAAGHRAIDAFHQASGPPLDVVYTAKSGAALLDLAARPGPGPLLFWASKSSAPLPEPSLDDLARAPRPLRQWLEDWPG